MHYCLICWCGSVSVKNRVLLDRVVRSANKTTGTTLPTVNELYETCAMGNIIKDTSHPLHEFYYVTQSGCRYISKHILTNRYRNTFLPTSVRLLNAKSRRGSDRGGWGDTMVRTTIISIVNTNVVLCCVMGISTTNISSWGILKVIVLYCIVLYCIVLYCIVLYCIVLYCIVLYCIVLYCIVLYCIVYIYIYIIYIYIYYVL